MFFFIPLGHDRSVYGYPWATIALIALCSVIWIVSFGVERSAMDGINEAAAVVDQVHSNYPRARVSWEMHGLPPDVTGESFSALMDPQHTEAVPGDAQLDVAMRDLVAQMNRLPVLRFGYRPGAPSIGTMFTGLFMHGGFFHLFGNMIFLFLTGSVIECFWGRGRFLALYFVSGVVATLTYQFFHAHSLTPLVGASGAIAGLMGAFLVGHPHTKVRFGYIFWFFFVPKVGTFTVPAWGALIAWIAQQFVFALVGLGGGGDGVAYWAHVGGFLVGALAALAMKHFDLFSDDAKELLAEEQSEPQGMPTAIAAEPLARRRAAWVDEARRAAARADAGEAKSSRAGVESIAVPGFEGQPAWAPREEAVGGFDTGESVFDADDAGISIPLESPARSPDLAETQGLPADIIPEAEMHKALPESERYQGHDPDHSIPLPGFDKGPALPEPTGGFEDES
ncbi:MAG: rhomboid family intramembrane serine protease [Deltaproteobacteria bacterium]|nr:rhomboid family intramembrane serine protease [Deltaproteobacteria bacterium]